MTIALAAPGVRFEHRRKVPAIGALRSDIALFAGIAERGPLHAPIAVESHEEFRTLFGGFLGTGYLAYALKAFFDNGGARAFVVRVAARDASRGARAADAPVTAGGLEAFRVAASSPGVWGNALSVTVQPGRRRTSSSAPSAFDARGATLDSVAGIVRGSHVRLSQPGGFVAVRVVSAVDLDARRIHFVHPDPGAGLASDLPVAGLDRNQSLGVDTLTYTFVVRERGRVVELHTDCTMVAEHPRFVDRVLARRRADEDDPDALTDVPARIGFTPTFAGAIPPALDDDPAAIIVLADGRDGLATLTVEDFVGDPFDLVPRGIEAAAAVDEIAIVAVPDLHIRPAPPVLIDPLPPGDPCDPCAEPPPAPPVGPPLGDVPPVFSDADILRAQSAIVEHCERLRYRFAVLDAPLSAANEDVGVGPVTAWRRAFETPRAALYFPWVEVPDPRGASPLRALPPSGHVVGQMAALDLSVGAHRPPANVLLAWLSRLTRAIGENEHAALNDAHVNVLRVRAGLGPRVLGARTLSSDPLWRFVNTRRIVMVIEKSIELGSRWAVFEPNNPATRKTLAANLATFLAGLWQRGALRGRTAGDAFAVRCDDSNNPASERANGRLLADVALAPVGALEFVVVRLGRIDDALQLSEQPGGLTP